MWHPNLPDTLFFSILIEFFFYSSRYTVSIYLKALLFVQYYPRTGLSMLWCTLWEMHSHLNVEVEAGGRRVSVCLAFQCHVITFLNGACRQNLQVHLLSGVWKKDNDRDRQSMKARGTSVRGKGAASAWHIQQLGSFSGARLVVSLWSHLSICPA